MLTAGRTWHYLAKFVRNDEFILVLFDAFSDVSTVLANNFVIEQSIEEVQGEHMGRQWIDANIVNGLIEWLPFAGLREYLQRTENNGIFEEILSEKCPMKNG